MSNKFNFIDFSKFRKKVAIDIPSKKDEYLELPEDFCITAEYEKAERLINKGCPVLFISGKAGTGKSTFIKYLRSKTTRKHAVLAPTGIAAININGQTIHSFCQFPPRIIDKDDIKELYRKKELIEKIDLLIIDEASMIRCDVFDGIDLFLRKNRTQSDVPFGGVQIVLVGDFYQLPPVAKPKDWEILKQRGYESTHFFSAKCMKLCQVGHIELTKVYRQENSEFIEILNNIRENKNITTTLSQLNDKCYSEDKEKLNSNMSLVCKNNEADVINFKKLSSIDSRQYEYKGVIIGNFKLQEDHFPAPTLLKLKVGAHVMFTKNDPDKRWVNGTLGKVLSLNEKEIMIVTQRGEVEVQKVSWEKVAYKYNPIEDKIAKKVVGSYTQYPLMLAWAITIHKSQGKTLQNIVIDLGHGAFAYGQTYVALSRCPTINDITLKSKINESDIKVDPKVVELYEFIRENSG